MGLTTRPSNVRVCQFRHGRVLAFGNAKRIILIQVVDVKLFSEALRNKSEEKGLKTEHGGGNDSHQSTDDEA